MNGRFRIAGVMVIALGLASGAQAQPAAKGTGGTSAIKAMENAMKPGEGQKRLEFLVGTFDVKIRTWIDPSKPPYESTATSVATWVLGGRYVQQMLAGYIMGQPWSGIGYAGYDNAAKKYVATYMDSGSTGMEWFTGALSPDGKLAKMTATIPDDSTGKPVKVEMRLSVAPNGDHVTEIWQAGPGGKLAKVIELQYTRQKS